MGKIATTDARGLFTKMLGDVYKERPKVYGFLRSFFETKEGASKNVAIQVQRGSEYIAVDVERGTEGNRNTFGSSSEKIWTPPYYREWMDATDLDFYDQLFGTATGEVDDEQFAEWLDRMGDHVMMMRDKIERSYELQCAQALEDGIVQLVNGDNIDFKRKAGSLVDLSGTPWSGANDPIPMIEAGCTFLRQQGKMTGGEVNMIMGDDVANALLSNSDFKDRANLRRVSLVDISMPQVNAEGGVHKGIIAAGSYTVHLWSYPEYYDTKAASNIPYIDPKKIILIPRKPRFKLMFGAVPMVKRDKARAEMPEYISNVRSSYVIGNRLDDRGDKHIFDVKSAGIAVPVAVDQIYTAQVLA